jgi:choline dehydrogenase-like flavoprotein
LLLDHWVLMKYSHRMSYGRNAAEGVVDSIGLFKENSGGYDRLYVVDGSIIPSSLDVNPSLTLACFAFRNAENALAEGNREYFPS